MKDHGAVVGWIWVLLLIPSCGGHIIHPAAVKSGPVVQIAAAVTRTAHEPLPGIRRPPALSEFQPYESTNAIALLNLGWGWRFGQNFGFQATLGAGIESAPVLATYMQVLGTVVDAGAGIYASTVAGTTVGAYALIGRELALTSAGTLRVDLGARFERYRRDEPGTGFGPQALISLETQSLSLGIWSDHFTYAKPFAASFCNDSCAPKDVIARQMAFGFLLSYFWN